MTILRTSNGSPSSLLQLSARRSFPLVLVGAIGAAWVLRYSCGQQSTTTNRYG
jgi:hypothetical protein